MVTIICDYMVDLVLLQSLSYMAGALGVGAAAFYYIMTLRNTEKIRRKDIIFQSNAPRSPDYYALYYDIVPKLHEYSSRNEYNKKFSSEVRSKHNYLYMHFNTIGVLFKDGMASAEEIFQIYPPHSIIQLWEVTEPLMRETREDSCNPEFLKPFELLALEAKKKPQAMLFTGNAPHSQIRLNAYRRCKIS